MIFRYDFGKMGEKWFDVWEFCHFVDAFQDAYDFWKCAFYYFVFLSESSWFL